MRRVTLIALFVLITSIPRGFAQDQDAPVSTRKIVFRLQSQYPPMARAAHIGGIVRVMARVKANGKVESVEVLGGHPLLAQAAVSAVSQWKWEPSSDSTEEIVLVRFTAP